MPNDKLKKSADFYSGFSAELKPIAHDTTFLETECTHQQALSKKDAQSV